MSLGYSIMRVFGGNQINKAISDNFRRLHMCENKALEI